MSGYIKLHRGWRDSEIFKGEFSRADAWVWLIENACWQPSRTRVKGSSVALERGELSFAQRFLAEKWGWSKSRVDRFIAELREEGMIETRSKIGATAGHNAGQGQSIIKLCNYDKYQSNDAAQWGNDEPESGAMSGQQRGKEEEGKEGKKEKNNIRAHSLFCPDGVDAQVWNDFQALRKMKRAPLTATALAAIEAEARKVGWSLQQALTECVARGWQGFKAEWITEPPRQKVKVPV